MVTISVLYPNLPEARFDMAYYLDRHMPLSIKLMSAEDGYLGVTVEKGLAGGAPGAPATYVAMCHYRFESPDSFFAAFGKHADQLQPDMAAYTDIEPIIQISDVAILRN